MASTSGCAVIAAIGVACGGRAIAVSLPAPDAVPRLALDVERTTRAVIAAASPRLRSEGIVALEVRLRPTLSLAQVRCSATPALEIDPEFLGDTLARGRRRDALIAFAFVIAHELGHLPTCEASWDAELRADEVARDALTELYGDDAKIFLKHPVPMDFVATKARLLAAHRAIDSPDAMARWARELVHLQELIVRDGRVYSTFFNVNLSRDQPKWAGELPFGYAALILEDLERRPELSSPQAIDAAAHARRLEDSVLAFVASFDRPRYVAGYDTWRGPSDATHVLAAGLEVAHAAVGGRISLAAPLRRSAAFNVGLRLEFRELRFTGGGDLAARTVGAELANTLVAAVGARTALGVAPVLGWEWDVQQRGAWSRTPHRAVSGLAMLFDRRLGARRHLSFGAEFRSPLFPQPGRGWSALGFAALDVCLVACDR